MCLECILDSPPSVILLYPFPLGDFGLVWFLRECVLQADLELNFVTQVGIKNNHLVLASRVLGFWVCTTKFSSP